MEGRHHLKFRLVQSPSYQSMHFILVDLWLNPDSCWLQAFGAVWVVVAAVAVGWQGALFQNALDNSLQGLLGIPGGVQMTNKFSFPHFCSGLSPVSSEASVAAAFYLSGLNGWLGSYLNLDGPFTAEHKGQFRADT